MNIWPVHPSQTGTSFGWFCRTWRRAEYCLCCSSAHNTTFTDIPLCSGDHCVNVFTCMDTIHLCWACQSCWHCCLQLPEALQQRGDMLSAYWWWNSQTKNSCEMPDHFGELITDRTKSYRKAYLKGVFLSTVLLLTTPGAPLFEQRLYWSEHKAGTMLRPGAERSKNLLLFLKSSLKTVSKVPHSKSMGGFLVALKLWVTGSTSTVYLGDVSEGVKFTSALAAPKPSCSWLADSPRVNHWMSLGTDILTNINSSAAEKFTS